MNKFIVLLLVFVLGLACSAALWVRTREQVERLTSANALRKTLGDMTIALTRKDREIDRLAESASACTAKSRTSGPVARMKAHQMKAPLPVGQKECSP